jgi:hypothetical protein
MSSFGCVVLFLLLYACHPQATTVSTDAVHPELRNVAELSTLTVLDTLESLIANRKATEADRQFAYHIVSKRKIKSSEDAFARAAIAGRLAEISGMSAGALVAEVEQYARMSLAKDASFRSGSAQRMLGTLYVLAPRFMLKHGDSEDGLELLEQLVQKWPADIENHLRVAEAYIALGDEEPAIDHLCFCLARKRDLRLDDRELLESLIEEIDLQKCPN